MKSFKNIIFGIAFLAVGIILGLNALNIVNVNIFFDGWWTLFIIIPFFIDLFTGRDVLGDFFGLVIGVSLLLACQDVISFDLLLKLIVPFIFVVIGISFMFKNKIDKKITKRIEELNYSDSDKKEYKAVFAGQEINYGNKEFKGCDLRSSFGGIDFDLGDSIINDDVVINASATFGGIDIKVPENVNVEVSSSSIFGGVDSDVKNKKDNKVTIYINAKCIFGGIDVK